MDDKLTNRDQISEAVTALKKYLQGISTDRKNLLSPVEQEDIHLQFSLKKISLKKKTIKIQLPHSLVDETTSICLFVRDDDRTDRDYSVTVESITEKLDKAGVKQKIEIVPLKQLKLEYKEYESKRSLLTLYDTFLADSRIVRLLPPQLGKHFYLRKRQPVQVNLIRQKNLKNEIDRAVCMTQCIFAGRGSSGQVTVARMSQSIEDIVDNVVTAVQRLSSSVAGGQINIRSLHLKVQDGPSLPFYISAGSKADVKFGNTNPKKLPMKPEDVTTITEGPVVVTKRGNVRVFDNSKGETVAGFVEKKRKKKTPSAAAARSRRRKLNRVPKLVALDSNDEEVIEVKQEPDEELTTQKKLKKKTERKETNRATSLKNKAKKGIDKENVETNAKQTIADEIKIEEAKEVSKSAKKTKTVNKKRTKRPTLSQPPSKKIKV